MRWLAVLLVLQLGFAGQIAAEQNETLAEALRRESIPFPPVSIPHLDSQITSYATLNDDQEFLIAYYLLARRNELRTPLFVTGFNKKTGRWRHKSLADIKVKAFEERPEELEADCLGSVLSIQRSRGRFYLDLHLSPSAGCLLILSRDLDVWQALGGWTNAFFKSGLLVFSGNMVHFACVHPGTLFLYDPAERKSEQIYPPKNDRLRNAYSARLEKVISPEQCAQSNCACDPQTFTSNPGSISVDDQTRSLAFRVDFEPDGFLTKEEQDDGSWDDDHYVYIYQLNPRRWRAFSIYDLKPKFGTDSLPELLTPAKLEEIFATSP